MSVIFRTILGLFVLVAATLAAVSAALAERRVALVVGNSDYLSFPDLANPRNDASDVATALERLGFEVLLATDRTKAELLQTVVDFAEALSDADTSLFFYAGHGIQVDSVNYVVPVDAGLRGVSEFGDELIAVDRIVQLMNEFTETALVFLDACRDNPLTDDIPIGGSEDGLGRGLARIRADGGSYFAFATAPGNVAYDGQGRNSPFTSALLRHIDTPNVDVRLMMADVRRDVFEATERRQMPWENNSLIGRFYFREDSQLSRLDDAQRTEAEAWQALSGSTRREDFAAFLRSFPDGEFASLADLKIETLDSLDERASQERADFILARSQNDVEAWRSFIDTYPASIFAEIATEELSELEDEIARNRLSLEELHWRSIRSSRSPEDFATFLRLYPSSQFRDLAVQRRDLATAADEITAAFDADDDADLEREIKRRVANVPVQFLQYGLIALGHQVSDISGVLDPATKRAIRNYQATIGDAQTGRLTSQQIVDLLLSAAALGDSHAMTAAGVMTASGHGLRTDEETARLWFDRASDLGNGLAMANLGVMYRDGRGGPRDVDRARSLLSVAATLGVDQARQLLRTINE